MDARIIWQGSSGGMAAGSIIQEEYFHVEEKGGEWDVCEG